MSSSGWIGVDLDGTLASHEGWTRSIYEVGPPVPPMIARVKDWLEQGIDVRIFTARAGPQPPGIDAERIFSAVDAWCLRHLGRTLPITNVKDYTCREIWDDRAVQVIRDTGNRADGMDGPLLPVPRPPKAA